MIRNIRFSNHDEFPFEYRFAYLNSLDDTSPEVMQDLKALVPKYEKVFGKARSFIDQFRGAVAAHTGELTIFLPAPGQSIELLFTQPYTYGDSRSILFNLTGRWADEESDVSDEESRLLKDFDELRQGFEKYINRYWLKAHWLRRDLFWLLGQIFRSPESFKYFWQCNGLSYVSENFEDISFGFRAWTVQESSREYEREVREAFNDYLTKYINDTEAAFRSAGYKRSRERDFQRVKWLVIWNHSHAENLWEIIQSIPGFEKVDVKKEKEQKSAVDRLRKAFDEFEGFGLPVRPWKQKVEK